MIISIYKGGKILVNNRKMDLEISDAGYVSNIHMLDDPFNMNWVIEDAYLKDVGYKGFDKLFGQFDITVNNQKLNSTQIHPQINKNVKVSNVSFEFEEVVVSFTYDLGEDEDTIEWKIELQNKTQKELEVQNFGVWASLAYVMFRDKNVLKNIHNSAAVFPSISKNYTKLSAVRRDGQGSNLGLYQKVGETFSVGTYIEYKNAFFENVSPSLDGVMYHKLILAGGYEEGFVNNDWIYSKDELILSPGETKIWQYILSGNDGKSDFYEKAFELGHPVVNYNSLNIVNEPVNISISVPKGKRISKIEVVNKVGDSFNRIDVSQDLKLKKEKYIVSFIPNHLGEHEAIIHFSDNTEDFIIFNVMNNIENVIEERVEYICSSLYQGKEGVEPYSFSPVSNQGESLGKLNLVLKKNLLGNLDPIQVQKVEESAVKYVREKWFEDGNFAKPKKLYGDFYRCMDFEYIGHLFFLLSEFDNEILRINSSEEYLSWAADVFNLRVNPELHDNDRGKEESQMLGVYFLYIQDLLEKLKTHGLIEKYNTISRLWEKVTERVNKESDTYKAAITEHFYDNAGFGPTAGALSESQFETGSKKYGQLLLANIGYSNDFRAQNPDRWWEALTYMIHSLWGGVTAASAFKVFNFLKDPEYLLASYRATTGILYCYDTHSTTTTKLDKGMAASTYAVAGPHLNRPDLSRDRFGQSTFYKDGGIFAKLFDNDSQTPDWDMGEELVAYLDGIGRKTFVLKENDGISVVNGIYEETKDGYSIKSFAPYFEGFYIVSNGKIEKIDSSSSDIFISKEDSRLV